MFEPFHNTLSTQLRAQLVDHADPQQIDRAVTYIKSATNDAESTARWDDVVRHHVKGLRSQAAGNAQNPPGQAGKWPSTAEKRS